MEGVIASMLANCIYYTMCLPEVEGMVSSCEDWTTSLTTRMNKWTGNLDGVVRQKYMSVCFNLLMCRHNRRLENLLLPVKLMGVCSSFHRGNVSYTVVASLVVLHRHGAVLLSLNGDEELQG
jgi:hypothetical protein